MRRHFALDRHDEEKMSDISGLITLFIDRRDGKAGSKPQELAADQLLNAVHLVLENIDPTCKLDKEMLVDAIWRPLSGTEGL